MSQISITFARNDGRTFAIDGSVLGLVSATGLDKANVEVFTQKAAVGDGDIVTGQRVGSRTLEFTAKARNAALNEVLRRAVTSYFTVTQTYAIYVTRYGEQRYAANCRLDEADAPMSTPGTPLTVKLSFLMPDGYFLSVDSFGKNIASIEGRAGYPYLSPANLGRVYGVYSFASTVSLENDGDAQAYCKAVFTAQGTVVNPKLIAGGGYVRVLCALAKDDVLVIDGYAKSVMLNGTNVSTKLDRASNFSGIVFAVGANSIGFTADIGSNLLAVNVYYNKRYMGA
ncbi:MAG TPA: phage tail family protein [Candidatus Limiplasma sp.]|nr:phage tail family protein [Candidatus Limiplasma sp.]HPS80521.1 phage tail family protein [Candidatus Limiplasma sp.]